MERATLAAVPVSGHEDADALCVALSQEFRAIGKGYLDPTRWGNPQARIEELLDGVAMIGIEAEKIRVEHFEAAAAYVAGWTRSRLLRRLSEQERMLIAHRDQQERQMRKAVQ